MEVNEDEQRRKPSIFLLFSLILFCFSAILNLIVIATEKWNIRKYEFSLILWISVVGIIESISIVVYLILKKKKKLIYPYWLAGIASGSTMFVSICTFVEYILYFFWNKQKETELWNIGIAYAFNVLVLIVAFLNILLYLFYIFYKRKKEEPMKR